MLLQASEEWTPKPSPPHSLPPVLGRSEQQEEMMRWKKYTNLSINKKQNMCTVHCKRSFSLSIFVLFFYLNSASIGITKNWRERWKVSTIAAFSLVFIFFTRTWESEQETFFSVQVKKTLKKRKRKKYFEKLLFLLLLRYCEMKWKKSGILMGFVVACWLERCWADNFSSLCFSSHCDCYVNISWSSPLCWCCYCWYFFAM